MEGLDRLNLQVEQTLGRLGTPVVEENLSIE
jgi:hypothetical protein